MIGAESAEDYLLKAVRVFTAVFWAAALVLGEPCRKYGYLAIQILEKQMKCNITSCCQLQLLAIAPGRV